MIEEILTAAGIPSQAARFYDPPPVTYAVYFDSVTAEGPDAAASRIFTHDCTVELYAPTVDEGATAAANLEEELDALGIPYSTQGWYWLSETQRYQEIFEFTHIEKT